MHFAKAILSLLVSLAVVSNSIAAEISESDAAWFETKIRPILSEHCQGCHSHGVGKTSGGLSLDSREDLLAGGDSGQAIDLEDVEASILVSAIRREGLEMPPEKPLPDFQQALLVEWIKRGAPWPKYDIDPNAPNAWLHVRAAQHWAWKFGNTNDNSHADQPLRSRIDGFVDAKLKELELQPSPQGDSLILLRRLYCDLTGLPPTLDQIDSFKERLATSGSQEVAIQTLVDELLASKHYGIHWARHWLDLVRYAEGMGHEFDFPIHQAWRYRDAVIKALNDDVPYDRFVKEHIAGDLLAEPRLDSETGINQSLALTGWWWLGDSVQAPVDVELDHAVRLDNQIDVFSKTFQGMTVACARCHDHKFDAIAAADYYGVAGILRSSRRLLQPTDPNNKIANFNRGLAQQITSTEDELCRGTLYELSDESSIQAWFTDLIQRLKANEKLREELTALDHPLAWMIPLTNVDPSSAWPGFKNSVAASSTSFNEWLATSTLLADFSNGVPNGWRHYGDFGFDSAADKKYDWLSSDILLPRRSNVFATDTFGKKQRVILESPDFVVPQNSISVLGSGHNSTSTIHVDGYYMQEFHTLLFGDMRKPFQSPNHKRWITHHGDLNKYVGHRAFLSFEDVADGWFTVSQIRSADAPAPVQPAASTQHIASAAATNEATTLATRYLREQFALIHRGEEVDRDFVQSLDAVAKALGLKPCWALNSDIQQRKVELGRLANSAPDAVDLLTIVDASPIDSCIAVRGNPHTPGDIAPRGCFRQVIDQPEIASGASGRLELARGITTADHPLTSRVIVNRIWAKLLGTGLVASPDNFGVLGGRPSHPELLDELARDFTANNWSIKRLVREIVLSETYQRSSSSDDHQKVADPQGLMLSHRTINRMPAESIRDSLLQFSDNLNDQMYGPPVPIYLTDAMTGRGRPQTSGPLDGANRRTIFVDVRRNFLNPFLLAFDMPLPSTTVGQRSKSNVPAQSLSMLNDPFVELAAQRWVDSHASSIQDSSAHDALLGQLFLSAFTRAADDSELSVCRESLHQHPNGPNSSEAWMDLVMTIVNSKEFIFIR